MKKIAFNVQKGGVGKTTSAMAMASALNMKGYKVLLVDMDAQMNLSLAWYDDIVDRPSIYDAMCKKVSIRDCIYHIRENLDLIPGDQELHRAERHFVQMGREKIVKKLLAELENDYDFCIIDTPPTLNLVNDNALMCADGLIIPITPDKYAVMGISQLMDEIGLIREENPNLEIMGILVTKYDHTIATAFMMNKLKDVAKMMKTFIYEQTIRNGVAVRKAQDLNFDMISELSKEPISQDYIKFTDEFLNKYGEVK